MAKYILTCVKAEHSQYFSALQSLANFWPCSIVIGFCLFLLNLSNVDKSSLKSACVPTSIYGADST